MRKNNKGFMLAEAVVSGTIIITSMIILYATFNKLYVMYSVRNSYYNVDGIYAARMLTDYLFDNNFNKQINNIFENSTNYILIANGYCQEKNVREKNDGTKIEISTSIDQDVCEGLQKAYNISTLIITEYDKSVLLNDIKVDVRANKLLKDDGGEIKEENFVLRQTFSDYLDFVVNYYDVGDGDTRYSYIILVETNNGEDYYYSSLGIG